MLDIVDWIMSYFVYHYVIPSKTSQYLQRLNYLLSLMLFSFVDLQGQALIEKLLIIAKHWYHLNNKCFHIHHYCKVVYMSLLFHNTRKILLS